MIIGIGTDIIDIRRIEKAMQNPDFIKRILTANEQMDPRCKDANYIAKRWCGKEACIKAFDKKIGFQDIEISNSITGQPLVKILTQRQAKVLISLSDEHPYAIAYVVVF